MAKGYKTKAQILAVNDIREEEMEIPEWDCTLRIRGFTLAQRHRVFEQATNSTTKEVNSLRATLLTFIEGVIEPRFSMTDMDALRDKSAAVERVSMRILALSGVGKDALEASIKNSETQSDDSSTS